MVQYPLLPILCMYSLCGRVRIDNMDEKQYGFSINFYVAALIEAFVCHLSIMYNFQLV
jgi:hypothetical protein